MKYELTLEAAGSKREVWALLERAASLYTGGGSTSVPKAVAAKLLEGICRHMAVGAGRGDAFADYEAGVDIALKKTAAARRRYAFLAAQARDWGNISLRDTLKGLGEFFRLYQPRLFPLDTPGDIDYQLSIPVEGELCGVDYVLEYIRRLTIETRFTLRFDEREVEAVMAKYDGESGELLINVFDMAFANAVARAIMHLPLNRLFLTLGERDALIDALYARSREFVEITVSKAIEDLSLAVAMRNADSLWYFETAGRNLCRRMCHSLAYTPDGPACELFICDERG
ncbi:MAG: DUF6179 domain-containing protein [Clostridia bacterium]|nr:DUF6179 domain-containing protein [Clostridia bacterium]